MRNILSSVGIGVEHHHAQRVTVLPVHQIGDGGLVIGAVEIGLCERRAELRAVVVEDDVVIFGRTRETVGSGQTK